MTTNNYQEPERTTYEKAKELLTPENIQMAVQLGAMGIKLLRKAAPMVAAAAPVIGAAAVATDGRESHMYCSERHSQALNNIKTNLFITSRRYLS